MYGLCVCTLLIMLKFMQYYVIVLTASHAHISVFPSIQTHYWHALLTTQGYPSHDTHTHMHREWCLVYTVDALKGIQNS